MKRRVPVLIPFLVFISAVFIGILIFAYIETRKANPQMIEVGQVVRSSPGRRVDNPPDPMGTPNNLPHIRIG